MLPYALIFVSQMTADVVWDGFLSFDETLQFVEAAAPALVVVFGLLGVGEYSLYHGHPRAILDSFEGHLNVSLVPADAVIGPAPCEAKATGAVQNLVDARNRISSAFLGGGHGGFPFATGAHIHFAF